MMMTGDNVRQEYTGPINTVYKAVVSSLRKIQPLSYHIKLQKARPKRREKKHLTNMSGSDIARKVVADVSGDDLDKWVRSGTLTNELEEVRKNHPQYKKRSIQIN